LHVYFSIKKGETLIEPTYDARIFVLSGHGVVRWRNEKYEINEKEYYYINPMIEDKLYIENYEETPLEILYI
jgi:mannose-6-phosphate isomerase-like protein (cupin superfamily)